MEFGDIEYIYPAARAVQRPGSVFEDRAGRFAAVRDGGADFSPYVLAAYDYYHNEGWYVESGIKHDFTFEDYGLTITPQANVGWISGFRNSL